jgi:hypothetical protein
MLCMPMFRHSGYGSIIDQKQNESYLGHPSSARIEKQTECIVQTDATINLLHLV